MGDKPQQLVLEALQRMIAEPEGLPLFGNKAAPGLFAGTAPGKQAALVCQQEGYLRPVRTEKRGKATLEICALSEKGLAFLLEQANPRPVLESFIRSLENRRAQIEELLACVRANQQVLEGMKDAAEKVLQHLQEPKAGPAEKNGKWHAGDDLARDLLNHLRHWQGSGTLDDCPLPKLYRSIQTAHPEGTIGQFHDALRRLHKNQQIYLHPWTGPLYEIPEPALALLVGHEVGYYASLRG